ncbi:amidase [Alsobacter sp. KACC 23698]|uniref:Amidase n=1 Tax=Alsobacter sp. KACC 23698 TaxID=3149229 RepID=A0AAU7JI49_9HYPH
MTDIADLTAVELLRHYRRRTLSPVEAARDALARKAKHEPAVNAFCGGDEDDALAMARASEARWAKGEPCGPVDGVPTTVKDNIAVKGWTWFKGSAVTSKAPAEEDAPAVARLREAGAVFLGKTCMPEFGWKGLGDSPLTGITRNPWKLDRTPGGSSSGAAACAALNIGCIHIGTDGAGSIRIPAAFTGVFGIKASYGRVPARPISTMGFLAHVGPLTRTVEDAALALSVIGRPDSRDMTAMTTPPPDYRIGLADGVRGLRIAWSPRLGHVRTLDAEIERLSAAAARRFEELGAVVEEVDPGIPDTLETLITLWTAGAALALQPFGPEERARMDPGLVEAARRGERLSATAYVDAFLNQRNAVAARMAEFHQRYDLLLTPTLATEAFEVGRLTPADGRFGEDWTAWTPYTYPFNISQQPAASVPCGLTAAGLPAGLQIVGPFGSDALVLRAARAYEALAGWETLSSPRA